MKILIFTNSISKNGQSVFLSRLLNHLSLNHTVILYEDNPVHSNEYVKQEFLGDSIKIISFSHNSISSRIAWKLNGLMRKLKIKKIDFVKLLQNRNINNEIKSNDPDLVFAVPITYLPKLSKIQRKLNFKLVFRMGGTKFLESLNRTELNDFNLNLISVHSIAYTGTVHFQRALNLLPNLKNLKVKKIDNGISLNEVNAIECPIKKNENTFVFGMISRGIKEKGWIEAINSFKKICLDQHEKDLHLILIGGGPYMKEIKALHESEKIHFLGETKNPAGHSAYFDVALLPTYYNSESVPNVLIEYLAFNTPVIATDYVEIPNMLNSEYGLAGTLIDITNDKANESQLAAAMNKYITDDKLIKEHRINAKQAFEKFNVEKCAENYLEIFS